MADVADIKLDSKTGLKDELAAQFNRAEALAMENSALRNTVQMLEAEVERLRAPIRKAVQNNDSPLRGLDR